MVKYYKILKQRRAFIQKYFHSDLTDPVLYDLNFDTAQYTSEPADGIVKDTRPASGELDHYASPTYQPK